MRVSVAAQKTVRSIGKENKNIAKVVMYLLTDKKETRPQKNFAELAANLRIELVELELVLEMIVKSGLVLEVPGTPKRYQLVHDYLVPFVRPWENANKLLELRETVKEAEALSQSVKGLLEKVQKDCDQIQKESEELLARVKIKHKWLGIFIIINIIIFSIRVVDIIIRGVA